MKEIVVGIFPIIKMKNLKIMVGFTYKKLKAKQI